MKRFIVKFLLISVGMLFVLTSLLILIDSKQNGFFTLTLNQPVAVTETGKTIEIPFSAKDNYLGSIALPLSDLKKGNVSFQMRESSATSWYTQNSYNAQAFNILSPYPFGLSPIANSKDKKYIIKIESKDGAEIQLKSNEITTKYVYSKEVITSNKKILASFVLKKYFYFFIQIPVLFFSLLFAIVLLKPRYIRVLIKIILKRWPIYLYFVPLLLFITLPLSLLNHNRVSAEKTVEWILISLAVIIFYKIYTLIEAHLETKNEQYIKKQIIKSFIFLSCIALVIAAFQRTYILGGDDSRIFYLYPQDYFINFASKVGPDTAVSSLVSLLPPVSIAPFIMLLVILKKILVGVNLQSFLFVLNIIGGVGFFYVLLNYLFPGKKLSEFLAKMLASLFYVFSIFNFYTLFNSQLIAMYLVSIFPLSMYLYMRGIREGKLYLLGACAVLWSLFSFLLVALPWFASAILGFIPILVWFFWKQKKRFVIYNLFFLLFLLLLNAYWIYAASYSSIAASSVSQSQVISSVDYRAENALGIKATAEINKVFFPLINLYHYDIQANFQWPFFPLFNSWYLVWLPLNSFFIFLILLTGAKMKKNPLRSAYIAGVFSFLISIYFFTVNIGGQGINLFLFLSNHVPGFVMFRNMYDKFGFALAISFALLVSVCLLHFVTTEKRVSVKKGILVIMFLLVMLNAKPFLLNEFYAIPIWTTSNTYNSITGLNQDYLDLVQFIKNQDNPSRYLWVPLNKGNISQIQDPKEPNHYYSGISPLLFLSGKNDYSGVTSFEGYSSEITKLILNRNYAKLGALYQKFNVRYIIVNHTITSDIKQSYICNEKLCDLQDNKYEKAILGKKIKDFGSRYTLYEINPKFMNDKISLQGDNKKISYKKISNDQYSVTLSHVSNNVRLIFLDPYFPNWEVVSQHNYPVKRSTHEKIFNYANAWDINPQTIKSDMPKSEYHENRDGSIDMFLSLKFKKNTLYPITVYLSLLAYVGIIGYACVMIRRRVLSKIRK